MDTKIFEEHFEVYYDLLEDSKTDEEFETLWEQYIKEQNLTKEDINIFFENVLTMFS